MKDQGTISLKRADTFSNFIMLQHSVAAETVASLIICCGEKNRQSSNVIKKKFHTPLIKINKNKKEMYSSKTG